MSIVLSFFNTVGVLQVFSYKISDRNTTNYAPIDVFYQVSDLPYLYFFTKLILQIPLVSTVYLVSFTASLV